MKVDSFRFVSPLIKRYYQLSRVRKELPIPFSPLGKSLAESRLSLVTTGGLYHRDHDQPFDQERERREPAWGDPSYRVLPTDMDFTAISFRLAKKTRGCPIRKSHSAFARSSW